MGYVILYYYIIFPACTLICGIVAGTDTSPIKWPYPLFAGLLGWAVPLLSFGSTDFIFLYFNTTTSAAGLVIGCIAKWIAHKLNSGHKQTV